MDKDEVRRHLPNVQAKKSFDDCLDRARNWRDYRDGYPGGSFSNVVYSAPCCESILKDSRIPKKIRDAAKKCIRDAGRG